MELICINLFLIERIFTIIIIIIIIIKCMACRFTAQLQRSLASDDKSQSLHRNASILVEGGFEQVPETDARHYRTCCSSLRVRSWSTKPMHVQYRRLTEQPPVDMKETYGWLTAANLPAATEGLVVAAQDQALRTRYYELKILHRDISLLAACAV